MSLATTASLLACPIDGEAVTLQQNTVTCPRGHSFDVAGTGYLNLLPVQHKSSKEPGDSKRMVQARRSVLDAGLFTPLATSIAPCVTACLKSTPETEKCIVDAGCGEGFYTNFFALSAVAELPDVHISTIGVDISKPAIQSAAKRFSNSTWIVGSNKQLPLIPGCASVITSLFGFEMWQAWFELQQPGQFVITVDAGQQHLIELRQLIYEDVKIHDAPTSDPAQSAGYELEERLNVCFQSEVISLELLQDLLAMTPHGYRANGDDLKTKPVDLPMMMTIDAVIRIYRRA